MATRKQTPDVLSEILGGEPSLPATEPTAKPGPAAKPEPAIKPEPAAKSEPAKRSPRRQSTRQPRAKDSKWAYMEVVFRDYGGYRPRYVNGQEQSGWKGAPVIHEYLNQLGEDGWELVGVGGRHNDEMPAYFKRAKR